MIDQRAPEWYAPRRPRAPEPADSWLDEVALEMWVDVKRSPTVVALAGILDDDTAMNVRSVVTQLVADGHQEVLVDVGRLSLADGDGLRALTGIEAAVRRHGGTVTWSFGPDNEPGRTLVLPPSRVDPRSAATTMAPG
jgi:anti-anti-sigma factor